GERVVVVVDGLALLGGVLDAGRVIGAVRRRTGWGGVVVCALLLGMGQAAVGGGVDVGLALADRRGRRVGARDHHRLEGVKLCALTRDRGAVRVLAWQEVV